MNRILVLLVVLIVLAAFVAGCQSGATTVTTTPVPTSSTPAVSNPATTGPATTAPTTTKPPTSSPVGGTQKYGGVLTYVANSGPGAPFGVAWMGNGTSTFGMQFAMEMLLKEMADGSIEPGLAESYDVDTNPDSPSITLHLRKGVKFQDGTDFNAQAVKWNLDMSMNAPGSTTRGSTTNWTSLDLIDDYTLKINLKSWQNIAVRTFADSISFMASPTAYETNGAEWMNWNMVGTGAFMQKSFERDVVLAFNRNPNYWQQGKPYLDGLNYTFVSDAMTAEALFKSGGGDILQAYTPMMASDLQAAGYKIITFPGMGANLWPDSANADSPWSNVKFRMAAEYAIDKEAMAKAFGYGFSEASYQANLPSSPAYDPSLTPRKYDVAKAKQLLAEAGYPDGVKTNIYVGPFGGDKDIALAIQGYWAAVGIKAEVQYPQAGVWSTMQTGSAGWHNGVLYGAGPSSSNPNAGWRLTYGEGSIWFPSLERPEGFAELYNQSLSTTSLDPTILKKCEDILFNAVNVIPLMVSSQQWVVTDEVMDTGLGTRGFFSWFEPQDMWLNK